MRTSIPVELVGKTYRDLEYEVLFDINGDGIYEYNATDDATIEYINTDLEMKNPGEVLGKPSSSNASITLFNESGLYSPNKSGNAGLRRNTKVRILGGFIDSDNVHHTDVLFEGVITNFKNNVKIGDKKLTLTLKDMAKFAQKKKNPNHTYVNGVYYEGALFDSTISDAINYLVDFTYGESYPRTVQALTVKIPSIEFPKDNNVWSTMQTLAESVGASMYFEQGEFYFITPLSPEYVHPSTSQYTFNADNIFDLAESIDEENIRNKWIINSNGKTLQPRQVIVGTPTTNTQNTVEYYRYNDGKNAVDSDGVTITLKCQDDDDQWVDTINVPMVKTTVYTDLVNPTADDIKHMNENSLIKVWDIKNGTQLTIRNLYPNHGKIVLVDPIDIDDYSLQISYDFYTDRILHGRYRDYDYTFDKMARNIELPAIDAHDGYNMVDYSTETSTNTLYLSKWTVLDNNSRVTFRLTNNVPTSTYGGQALNIVYINKMEIYGNPLDCLSPLSVKAEDATTLSEFENAYTINNDYIIDSDWAQKIADFYLYRTKSDKSFIDINTPGIPQIQLLDRVTLNEITTGFSSDFIVIGIKHTPRIDGWKTTLSLESLKPAWAYDSSNTYVDMPVYDQNAMMVLPTIDILSNDDFEDNFANNAITHSVVLNFVGPSQLNIADFLDAKILYQVYNEDTTSWGRYVTVGSFNDSYVASYKITGLLPDKQYRFYVIATNKRNQQSPYGDGYILNTPTTNELQSLYGLISAPTNIQLVKGLNSKLNVSCAPSGASHYKLTRFQFVGESLEWTDDSVQTQDIKGNSATFSFPDENNYQVRVSHVDIWDREGTWSSDYGISGGKIGVNDFSASLLEVVVSSNPVPIVGTLDNLIDGTDTGVAFNSAASITYKYPYESIFDGIRIRVPNATTMYAEVKDSDDNWQYVVGTNMSPVNLIANTEATTANVFQFHVGGNMSAGEVTRKSTKEVRLTFPSSVVINEIMITTFQYLDTLIVGGGIEIKDHLKMDNDGISVANGSILINSDGVSGYSDGTLQAKLGTDGKFVCGGGSIVGDADGLSIANGPITMDSTGLKTWNQGVTQVSVGTDGKLVAGAGNVIVDANGIAITGGKIQITNPGGMTIIDGTSNVFKVHATGVLPNIIGNSSYNNYSDYTFQSTGSRPTFLVYTYNSYNTQSVMWDYYRAGGGPVGVWPVLMDNTTLRVFNYYGITVSVRVYIFKEMGI